MNPNLESEALIQELEEESKALVKKLQEYENNQKLKKKELKEIFNNLKNLIIKRNKLLWLYYLCRNYIIKNYKIYKDKAKEIIKRKLMNLSSQGKAYSLASIEKQKKFIEEFVFRSFTKINERTRMPNFNLNYIFIQRELPNDLPKNLQTLSDELLTIQKEIEEKIKEYLEISGTAGEIELEKLPKPINSVEEYIQTTKPKTKPKKPGLFSRFTRRKSKKGGRKTRKRKK